MLSSRELEIFQANSDTSFDDPQNELSSEEFIEIEELDWGQELQRKSRDFMDRLSGIEFIPVDADDSVVLVLFSEMNASLNVLEIATSICATSRMVVKEKGGASMMTPCFSSTACFVARFAIA